MIFPTVAAPGVSATYLKGIAWPWEQASKAGEGSILPDLLCALYCTIGLREGQNKSKQLRSFSSLSLRSLQIYLRRPFL